MMHQLNDTTQTALARELGIDQSYLSRLLRRARRPSAAMAQKLADATSTHVLYWLYPGKYDQDGNPTSHGQGE